jgi:hypothetical protein
VELVDPLTITLVAGSTYRIGGLQNATSPDGRYLLTISAAGIQAADDGAFGTGSDATTWVVDNTPPTVLDVADVSPDPRETPVETVDVIFSEPLQPDSFSWHDLTLTRDGQAIALSSAVTVAWVSGATYRISGLDGFTGFAGEYELTVLAAEVYDLAGNAGTGSVSAQWTNSLVQPDTVAPDQRSQPAAAAVRHADPGSLVRPG